MSEPKDDQDEYVLDAIFRRHLEKSDMGQEAPRKKNSEERRQEQS